MKITKYGHACLLVEVNGAKVLTDPGVWNVAPDATGLDAIVITHEHQDHCDLPQLRQVIANNPGVRVITHSGVGKILQEAGITYETIEHGAVLDVKGVSVESCGTKHAVIYCASPCQNTGYHIGGELFVPGDALHNVPRAPVRVLALPTGGPWMKIAEAIDYAKSVKPEIVFPVHDAMYVEDFRSGLIARQVSSNLQPVGITFVDMPAGASKEF